MRALVNFEFTGDARKLENYRCARKFMSAGPLGIVGPGGSHDTLMGAVVTTPFGSVMDASMPYDVYFDVPAMTKQQLSFQLRDRSYNVLTIVPNISFQLTIE